MSSHYDKDYCFTQVTMGFTVTGEDQLPPVRLRDPWWRKPLVLLGILCPRYRPGRWDDFVYGDVVILPLEVRGFSEED